MKLFLRQSMHCTICYNLVIIMILLTAGRSFETNGMSQTSSSRFGTAGTIPLEHFQSILSSEVNTVVAELELHDQLRRLRGGNSEAEKQQDDTAKMTKTQEVWDDIVQHGWDVSRLSTNDENRRKTKRRLYQDSSKFKEAKYPFLLCSHSSRPKSAYRRLQPIMNLTNACMEDISVVRNDPKSTCYHVFMEYDIALKIKENFSETKIEGKDYSDRYTVLPMTDLMKIQYNTIKLVSDDKWTVPPKNSTSPDDWERRIRIGLSSGFLRGSSCTNNNNNDDDLISNIAMNVIQDIKSMSTPKQNTANTRRRMNKEGYNFDDSSTAAVSMSRISEKFSLTTKGDAAPSYDEQERSVKGSRSKVRRSRRNLKMNSIKKENIWSRALELGLEADHSCKDMFNTMKIYPHFCNAGFDIVLNPTNHSYYNDGIEEFLPTEDSSASNINCILSFIMALSTNPLVLSIESDAGPVLENDYESQWITQTKVRGSLPLHDIGIKGKNQVISIIDSGLDINHKYFGPTDPSKIFDQWDFSQRKVVRYDNSVGDKREIRGGHGTKVAGVAVGKSNSKTNDVANGVAEDAKLHLFDIVEGEGRVMMPEDMIFKLFASMHSTNKFPARIANGSWNTPFSPYPTMCRFFDKALHGRYTGDLYVASAGNDGLDVQNLKSRVRTIGNPAACKNTLAVGASQSHGERMLHGNGVDYLAAFSSRGPTHDGRMKPEIVAPGATVLTAYAHESGKTVQAYGSSYSAPAVSGNAALIRQYFEEGHLPCNWGDCKFDPSGSLVKAVLINSARSIKRVQVSRSWLQTKVLEELSEYDYSQGNGLIQLDNTLPIAKHNKITAAVRNNKLIGDGEYQDIFIRATPGRCIGKPYQREFSATLTWYDPEGAVNCAKCLINDLDLIVHSLTGKGAQRKGSRVFPNGANRKDYVNNVERVRFKMAGSRRYRIRVHASNLESAKTRFSLIASGCFKVIPNPSK